MTLSVERCNEKDSLWAALSTPDNIERMKICNLYTLPEWLSGAIQTEAAAVSLARSESKSFSSREEHDVENY